MRLFSKDQDYEAFEGLLEETWQSRPVRICAYCLMPNHWHFVLWPEHDGDLKYERGTGALIDRGGRSRQPSRMPRAARVAPGGMVFHVLNRGVGRMRLFSKEQDYEAFEGLLEETWQSRPVRICAYCLMPNHWHFVLWPEHILVLLDRKGFIAPLVDMPVTDLSAVQLPTSHVFGGELLHEGRQVQLFQGQNS